MQRSIAWDHSKIITKKNRYTLLYFPNLPARKEDLCVLVLGEKQSIEPENFPPVKDPDPLRYFFLCG